MINPALTTPLRAAPHELVFPTGLPRTALRLWYGRMLLPPTGAIGAKAAVNFAEVAAEVTAAPSATWQRLANRRSLSANSSANSAHIAAGLPTVLGDAGCWENQLFCWMQCLDTDSLPCGNAAVCRDQSTGDLWDGHTHCARCAPTCDAPPPPMHSAPSPPVNSFCAGPGEDMHMRGFVLAPSDCLIFLFVGWRLVREMRAEIHAEIRAEVFAEIRAHGPTPPISTP